MPANKAAKTTARNHAQHPADDLRVVYERLGRIEILEGSLAGGSFVDVTALANLAQQQLGSGKPGNAAELLRAAEHMCFAALAPEAGTDTIMPGALKASIAAEFHDLTQRTEEHWAAEDGPAGREVIATLYTGTLAQARRAFARGDFRPALELARAAEALSLIGEGLPATVPEPGLMGRLAS